MKVQPWSLQRDRWGRGYATEGALAARDWAFRALDIPRLISITIPENRRSWHVMEKLGLTRRAEAQPWHGFDVEWWALDRSDWESLSADAANASEGAASVAPTRADA